MVLGVLLPAYNEGENIGTVIRGCKRTFPKARIVVVDDGSSDDTFRIAKSLRVTVLKHVKNRGKGEALKTGLSFFRKSGVEYVVIADTDRQYDIRDARRIVKRLKEGYDVVTGYRSRQQVPLANRTGNFIWRSLFNLLFGTRFKDTNCGFMGLNKNALEKIKNIHGGYIIENSILADCVRNGLEVGQVPVNVHYGVGSKVIKYAKMFFGVLFFIVKEGVKFRLERLKGRLI